MTTLVTSCFACQRNDIPESEIHFHGIGKCYRIPDLTEIEYTVGFLFSSNNVLLIHKTHPEWQAGYLNGIGGKIDPGENPHDGMVREFEEETGLHLSKERWCQFCELIGKGFHVYFFYAIDIAGEAGGVRSKTEEVIEWVPVMSLYLKPIIPNLNWLIPMALNTGRDVSPNIAKRLIIRESY